MGYNGVGRVVIDIHDKNVVISSPRGLMVSTEHNRDHQYDLSVGKYMDVSDKRAGIYFLVVSFLLLYS